MLSIHYNDFPNLRFTKCELTSPQDPRYNCIAWAAGDNSKWWWPDKFGVGYWPKKAPREESLDAFILAYSTLGYDICHDENLESGYEKVAIYVNHNGIPTHAARQLPSGMWTSKLGKSFDIDHTLKGLRSQAYGRVGVILKRKIS